MKRIGNPLSSVERERSLIRLAARSRLPQLPDEVLAAMDAEGEREDLEAAMREFYAVRLAEFHASLPAIEEAEFDFPTWGRSTRRGRS